MLGCVVSFGLKNDVVLVVSLLAVGFCPVCISSVLSIGFVWIEGCFVGLVL